MKALLHVSVHGRADVHMLKVVNLKNAMRCRAKAHQKNFSAALFARCSAYRQTAIVTKPFTHGCKHDPTGGKRLKDIWTVNKMFQDS